MNPARIVARFVLASAFVVLLSVLPATAGASPRPLGLGEQAGVGSDTSGEFVISQRAVRLRERVAGVRVSCRSDRGCSGTLVLKQRRIVTVGGERRTMWVNVGKRTFDYPARRRNAVLRVRLTRAAARAVSAKRRLRVLAVASVRFGDGTRAKPRSRFWLYPPAVS